MATALGLGLLAIAVAVFVTRWLNTRIQALVVAATFAYLALVPATIGLAVLGASGSPWWPTGVAVVFALLAVEVRPWLRRRATGRPVVRVLTANVWFGRGDPAAVLRLAREQDVDLVALQETTEEFVAGLRAAGIESHYPYNVVAAGPLWQGAALWSRLPLRDPHVTERNTLYRVEAVVRLGAADSPDDPHVTSVHVHAPWPGEPGPWVDQLEELGAHLRAARRPQIIAGDFNATLDHAPFRRLLREAADATVSARAWWARTWPTHLRIPCFITIDHVLVRGYRAARVKTLEVPGADHRALVAEICR